MTRRIRATWTHHVNRVGQNSSCTGDEVSGARVLYNDRYAATKIGPALAQVARGIGLLRRIRGGRHVKGVEDALLDEFLEGLSGVSSDNLSTEKIKLGMVMS